MHSDRPTCRLSAGVALRAIRYRCVPREASLPTRCAEDSRAVQLRGYPASTTVVQLRAHAGQNPLRVLVRPRYAVSSSVRESRRSGLYRPARLPPPPSRSSPPRCIGLREHTQLLLKGRVQTQMSMRKVSGVRPLHMSSLRHIAANRRQSYGYRTVRGSSWWTIVDLIYFRKRPLHCAARSLACFWPVAGLGIWTCECLAL
ncbi:hypothetical protein OKW30_007974 [Paraburkholderia sp. Clong3]